MQYDPQTSDITHVYKWGYQPMKLLHCAYASIKSEQMCYSENLAVN